MPIPSTPALAPVSVNSIDAALMRLPYERWTVMGEVSAHVRAAGLPRERLTTVVRTGRRRGVLRIRREPGHALTYVMRISLTPYPESSQGPT
ncbi:hypothetical protein ACFCWY_08490 [Streptomyces sp. NPDC056362]|uniref:hypothetical protein n=1 Tax=unclassified Streptomyces TaxID=2593676 RepID=UPI0035D6B9FF